MHDTHGPVLRQGAWCRFSSMVPGWSTGIGGGFGYHPSLTILTYLIHGRKANQLAKGCGASFAALVTKTNAYMYIYTYSYSYRVSSYGLDAMSYLKDRGAPPQNGI